VRTVDTKGQPCPAPIIATKKALREAKDGETIVVLTDSRTSLNNLTRFLKDNKAQFSIEESNGVWTLTITGKYESTGITDAEAYCAVDIPHFSKSNLVIAFTSDKMGEGNDELGRLLMANFVKAIKDLDELPSKMVFYNKGVELGKDDSPVIEHLRELERMGVELFLCATCAKFYSLEEKIHIGQLSNMFEIVQIMASAGNVIKP
jgi:selenium metabolism protein YedF